MVISLGASAPSIKTITAMNKLTRIALTQFHEQLVDIVSAMRLIGEQEQEKYDNAPENLQDSERVQAWQDCASEIEQVCDDLESAADALMDNVLCVY